MNSRLHCASPGKVGQARTYESVWCKTAPDLCVSLRLPSKYVTSPTDKQCEQKQRTTLLQLHSPTWRRNTPNSVHNLHLTQDRAKQKGNSIRNPEIVGSAG